MPLNLDQFAQHLRTNALPGFGQGKCAKYVRMALQAGGAQISQYAPAGRDFGPVLLQLGFHAITVDNPDTFHFMKGDVMVMQPYTGGNQNGHVAGYDGSKWISDFIQSDFWAGPGYRAERPSHVVYHY
ncbi:hypothetical protein [Duganella sp. Root336D2]|uniref:hypothetical protein n=1 Tax=Duganella sp. Root336D2 TaxID=1736518 RepID=UPI0006FF249B|nr:hypothetical protein [Duganella sp. Root336D2]KQV46624.1 hypothetical protein ASD07_14260 [Duganella sp. Root336D2]